MDLKRYLKQYTKNEIMLTETDLYKVMFHSSYVTNMNTIQKFL